MKFKSCRHIEWDNLIDEIFGEDYVKSEITDNLLEEIRKHVTTYIDNEPNELYKRTYYAEVDIEVREKNIQPTRPIGRWVKPPRPKAYDRICSACRGKCWNVSRNSEYKYCPNCGGRMESEEE